jgi:hypothetical protein
MTTVLEEIHQEPNPQQQTIQKQKRKKWLTIDEIMPKWSHLLDLYNADVPNYIEIEEYKNKHDLTMESYNMCMVGEAYRFNSDYAYTPLRAYCEYCEEYAEDYFIDLHDDIEKREYVGMNWRKTPTIIRFVNHWNIKHSGVTKIIDR